MIRQRFIIQFCFLLPIFAFSQTEIGFDDVYTQSKGESSLDTFINRIRSYDLELGLSSFNESYYFVNEGFASGYAYTSGADGNASYIQLKAYGIQLNFHRPHLLISHQIYHGSMYLNYVGYMSMMYVYKFPIEDECTDRFDVRKIEYASEKKYFSYSIGFAWKIFKQKSIVNLVPMAHLQFTSGITSSVLKNEYQGHYYFHSFFPGQAEQTKEYYYGGKASELVRDCDFFTIKPKLSLHLFYHLSDRISIRLSLGKQFKYTPFFFHSKVSEHSDLQIEYGLTFRLKASN